MKKYILISSLSLVLLAPSIATAQFGDVDNYIKSLGTFINGTLIPLLLAIAFLVFIWGIFKYFFYSGSDEDSRSKGRQLILWSVIGFVLIASIWGIVNLLAAGIDLQDQQIGNLPNSPLQ